jgi:hypothetical protein
MHSFKDAQGHLWVACNECERGGNGTKDKCSSGWKCKKFNGTGCFSGDLMDKYKKEAI